MASGDTTNIQRHLRWSPSLQSLGAEALSDGLERVVVDLTLRETLLSLRVFPDVYPYTLEQVLNPTFLCDTSGDCNNLA
ncbi:MULTISPECIES: DUF29 family protein [unclassified Thermosynechococcus]|uniref:DUF29 family protein n=1 Tax=unclassified Thermosynechococcus TaxID=2622553 RepID=UPI001981AE1C|nr:DUF29 family protein [Thermosynechococcus sp. TA-1]